MATYRPNVAAIFVREDGKILVAERADVDAAWQFPQGGVDKGEDLITALKREVEEEIGLGSHLYELAQCRAGYRYKFPKGHRKNGIWQGQEQTYFLCKFHGEDENIVLDGHCREFSRFRWIRPDRYKLKWLPEFKREVYRKVFQDFFGVSLK